MKKIAILSALTLTMSLGVSADQTKNVGWIGDPDDYYTYWAYSYDSNYQALMRKIEANEKSPAYIDFRLLLSTKSCHNIDSNHRETRILEINHQEIAFQLSCAKKETLNLEPVTEEGKSYIFEEFARNDGDNVIVRWRKKGAKDSVFHFSKANFKDYYKAVKKSVRKPI